MHGTIRVRKLVPLLSKKVPKKQKMAILKLASGEYTFRFVKNQYKTINKLIRVNEDIAYWDFFEYPEEIPLYGIVIESWWVNKDKQ